MLNRQRRGRVPVRVQSHLHVDSEEGQLLITVITHRTSKVIASVGGGGRQNNSWPLPELRLNKCTDSHDPGSTSAVAQLCAGKHHSGIQQPETALNVPAGIQCRLVGSLPKRKNNKMAVYVHIYMLFWFTVNSDNKDNNSHS